MVEKICCIFNIGPHYRAPIYKLMDKELECDFYFGDKVDSPIKLMDYNSLNGYQKTLENKQIPKTGFEWQKGAWKLIFKPYKHYIITGTPGSLSNWLLAITAILLRKKVYAWTHGMKGNNSKFGTFVEKNFYRLCYKILLYGEFSKKNMLKEGFKDSKLVPIYNSLDYERQVVVRKNLASSNIYSSHFNNNYPVLVYIGRIQKNKSLDVLIKAFDKINQENIPCNLVIIGEDVDGNNMPALVANLKLEKKVWFYGPCYDEKEIGNLLYNSDVCITPGLIGLTAIHSLTYGTPVITSDNFSKHGPEFEAIKPGITGDFFKTNDIMDLCQKIDNWISLDKVKRNEIRINSFKLIDEKYNPFYQIKIIKNLILTDK